MTEWMTRHWDQFSLHTTAYGPLNPLTLKLVFPRFFPELAKHFILLGVSAFLLAFTLMVISAG
jgi:hypothetical protein